MNAQQVPANASLATQAAQAFRAYRAGDSIGMANLVDMMTPLLWHTARAQRADAATAEDIVQTAWLKLVDHAEDITDPQAIMQWLLTTVRREAWRLVQQGSRTLPQVEVEDQESDQSRDVADPASLSILSERQRVLWRHVADLSERCRSLLRVIAFADKPDYAAVAEALKMPVGSIGPTRGRCLEKLRVSLLADARWGG